MSPALWNYQLLQFFPDHTPPDTAVSQKWTNCSSQFQPLSISFSQYMFWFSYSRCIFLLFYIPIVKKTFWCICNLFLEKQGCMIEVFVDMKKSAKLNSKNKAGNFYSLIEQKRDNIYVLLYLLLSWIFFINIFMLKCLNV